MVIEKDPDAVRRALFGLAYRMLGTVPDAEDAVQEAFVRWYRLEDEERAKIVVPGAWLNRVTSRICLDMLGSARARRESYVGPWLPEPLPADAVANDPLDQMTLDESVSTALLMVLESLTPAQRVAFVLHDVFAVPFDEIAETVGRSPESVRQLASQGRRRVQEGRAGAASRQQHDRVAQAFAVAVATGQVDSLIAVLDPDVVVRADGGGKISAARKPVYGADRVARFLLGVHKPELGAVVAPTQTPDGLGFAVYIDGAIDSVITLSVRGESVREVWIVRNPDKLTLWR